MSTKTEHQAEHAEHAGEHKHPPYMAVFVWLTILTAIEVFPIMTEIFFGFSPVAHEIWVPVLIILAIAKAALVGLYYMHLKYDKPWLIWMIMGPLAFAMLFGLAIVIPYQ